LAVESVGRNERDDVPNPFDRRKHRRIAVPLRCRREGGDYFALIEPVDISFGGLRVFSSEAAAVRGRLRLDLFFPSVATPVTFATQVRWVRPAGPGAPAPYDLGLAFMQLTSKALGALLPFLETQAQAGEAEASRVELASGPLETPVVILESDVITEPRASAPALRSFLSEIPVRVGDDELLRAAQLDPRSGFVLFLIDGTTTVDDLLDICAMPPDEMLTVLQDLRERGVIEYR
jgi:hypothetical protein